MSVYIEPKAKVTCPACNAEREVSARQKRRIERGIHDRRCWWCARGTRRANDAHLRYWLRLYGITVPKGVSPTLYIKLNGVPQPLLDLAYGLWPELEPSEQRVA